MLTKDTTKQQQDCNLVKKTAKRVDSSNQKEKESKSQRRKPSWRSSDDRRPRETKAKPTVKGYDNCESMKNTEHSKAQERHKPS